MFSRFIAAGLGLAAMAVAPAAVAAFPEDFALPSSASSSSSASSVSSAATGASLSVSTHTGSSVSSVSSSSVSSSSQASLDADDDNQGIGEAAQLAAAQELTRAEFIALIVEKLYSQAEIDRCYWEIASSVPPHFTLVFTDVHVNDRFAKHICVAMHSGLAKGYSDGSFRPEKKITFAESAKILARAFALTPYAEANRLQPWYREYTEALADRNAIPLSIERMDQLITAGEAAEIFNRLLLGRTALPSRSYDELQPKPRTPIVTPKTTPAVGATPRSTSDDKATVSSQSSVSSASSVIQGVSSSSRRSFWDLF